VPVLLWMPLASPTHNGCCACGQLWSLGKTLGRAVPLQTMAVEVLEAVVAVWWQRSRGGLVVAH
jgi:hypothetical protein